MKKFIVLIVCLVALSSCDILGLDAVHVTRAYTLSSADITYMKPVYSESYLRNIRIMYTDQQINNRYQEDMVAGYCADTNTIYVEENEDIQPFVLAHEVTHYFQHNQLNINVRSSNDYDLPNGPYYQRLSTEKEAQLVALYCYMQKYPFGTIRLAGVDYTKDRSNFKDYVKTYFLTMM